MRAVSERTDIVFDESSGQAFEQNIVLGDAVLDNAFEVTEGGGAQLFTSFSLPSSSRVDALLDLT